MYSYIPKPTFKKMKTSTKATSKEGVRKNLEWLKKHQRDYQGQWIALNEGSFLGANESFVKLRRTLKNAGQLPVALFFNLKMDM
jgi:hypothetical protein